MKTLIKIIILGLFTSCSMLDDELECECYENIYGVINQKNEYREELIVSTKITASLCIYDTEPIGIKPQLGVYSSMYKVIECD